MNTLDVKIEKGIPMPSFGFSKGERSAYLRLFNSMEIGDSIIANPELGKKINNYRGHLKKEGILLGFKKFEDQSYRIWRIK